MQKEFYPDQKKGEMVLIQGIIDAYFEEDGEIIVLDYKTDRVQTEAELKRPLPGTAPSLHQSPRTDHPEKSKRTDHLLLHPLQRNPPGAATK